MLRAELTAAPIQMAMQAYEKSATELIEEFGEPQATDFRSELMSSFNGGQELLNDLINSSGDVLEWEELSGVSAIPRRPRAGLGRRRMRDQASRGQRRRAPHRAVGTSNAGLTRSSTRTPDWYRDGRSTGTISTRNSAN